MLVHSVIFWLKKDLSPDDRSQFEKEVRALEKISAVDQIHFGKPAETNKRPVIDDTYDFFLTVILKDVSAHDHYQKDPIHLEFIAKCSHMWKQVKIYDAD